MAVPSSGSLEMAKLAKEKVYGSYTASGSITGPISMYDLVNGGNTNGSNYNFATTNTNSYYHPDTTTPHKFSEWYGYDHNDIRTLFSGSGARSSDSNICTYGISAFYYHNGTGGQPSTGDVVYSSTWNGTTWISTNNTLATGYYRLGVWPPSGYIPANESASNDYIYVVNGVVQSYNTCGSGTP